jgi:uncharacterized protein YndB with AHSA1/START domain
MEPRKITKLVNVDAPQSVVWDTWTTTTGVRTFLSPMANVTAKEGGPYELLFAPEAAEGARGTEGCTILALTAPHTLAFDVLSPPSISLGDARTRVIVHLKALDDETTRIQIVHEGFESGPNWDDAHFYYSEFWSGTVTRLRHRFEEGPVDWASAKSIFEWQ